MACCKQCPAAPATTTPSAAALSQMLANKELLGEEAQIRGEVDILSSGGCRFKGDVFENGEEWHPRIQPWGEMRCINCNCKVLYPITKHLTNKTNICTRYFWGWFNQFRMVKSSANGRNAPSRGATVDVQRHLAAQRELTIVVHRVRKMALLVLFPRRPQRHRRPRRLVTRTTATPTPRRRSKGKEGAAPAPVRTTIAERTGKITSIHQRLEGAGEEQRSALCLETEKGHRTKLFLFFFSRYFVTIGGLKEKE